MIAGLAVCCYKVIVVGQAKLEMWQQRSPLVVSGHSLKRLLIYILTLSDTYFHIALQSRRLPHVGACATCTPLQFYACTHVHTYICIFHCVLCGLTCLDRYTHTHTYFFSVNFFCCSLLFCFSFSTVFFFVVFRCFFFFFTFRSMSSAVAPSLFCRCCWTMHFRPPQA